VPSQGEPWPSPPAYSSVAPRPPNVVRIAHKRPRHRASRERCQNDPFRHFSLLGKKSCPRPRLPCRVLLDGARFESWALVGQHRTSKSRPFPSNHGSQRFEPPRRHDARRGRAEILGFTLIDGLPAIRQRRTLAPSAPFGRERTERGSTRENSRKAVEVRNTYARLVPKRDPNLLFLFWRRGVVAVNPLCGLLGTGTRSAPRCDAGSGAPILP